MMDFVTRLLARSDPRIAEARARDGSAIAAVHSASFQRGWSEDEFQRLLADRNVVAHRAMVGPILIGFILSRVAGGEAEILSVAIASNWRGRGFGGALLELHLRQLAGIGARTVFLEVGENNAAALRLYGRAGFYEVGRRSAYYSTDAAALVLRRDLS